MGKSSRVLLSVAAVALLSDFSIGVNSTWALNAAPKPPIRDCNRNGVSDELDVKATLRFSTSPEFLFEASGRLTDLASGDINSDGHNDLAVSDPEGIKLSFGEGNGLTSELSPAIVTISGPYKQLATGLLNPDNYTDLAWTNSAGQPSQGSIAGLINSGPGLALQSFSSSTGVAPTRTHFSDLNMDGHTDIVNFNVFNLSVLLADPSQGDGNFLPKVNYSAGGSGFYSDGAVADLNNDGYPDLVRSGEQHPNAVDILYNDGLGAFPTRVNLSSGTATYTLGVTSDDYNSDGWNDIAFVTNFPFRLYIALNNKSGGFNLSSLDPGDSVSFGELRSADLDGDHDTDLVMSGFGSTGLCPCKNGLIIFANNGSGGFAPQKYDEVLMTEEITLGDYTEDGLPDVATSNLGNGRVYLVRNTSVRPHSLDLNRNTVPDECEASLGAGTPQS